MANGDKTFIRITNRDIANEIKGLSSKIEQMNIQLNSLKLKLEKSSWKSTAAFTLSISTILSVLGLKFGIYFPIVLFK